MFLYYILNIFTFCLIHITSIWFPKIKLNLLYKITSLRESTHVGIIGNDGKYQIVDAYDIEVPKLNNGIIHNYCKPILNSLKSKVFEYKLLKYAYSPTKKSFIPIEFNINATFDLLSRKFTSGLNELEVLHQKTVFGKNYIEIREISLLNLISDILSDPFYIFQILAIILWLNNHYIKYALIIILANVISIAITINEIRNNLHNLRQMAKHLISVNIYRQKV